MRLKGRLENISDVAKRFPIFLENKSYFTELLIFDCHRKVKHSRVKATLNELRSSYWIPQGRQTVKRVIAKCNLCKTFDALAFQALPFAPLPEFRVKVDFPFSSTGVDYFGPLYVKNIFETDEHKNELYKVHGVLYTCATSRAVYIDLVPDTTCAAFIRSLKRFTSRYGISKLFISDNATCFAGAELTEFVQMMGSEWRFILEVSPWWGGFWERLIRTAKCCLRKCLGKAKLSYEELLTVLSEVECVLNSRPLCYIYSDSVDEVITPSHLLFGRRLLSTCDKDVDQSLDTDIDVSRVEKRFEHLKRIMVHFWHLWQHEYLTELREHQNCRNKVPMRQVQNGDLVLIHDKLPRNRWKMGVVIDRYVGKDGYIRGCKVRTLTKTGRIIYLNRPVNKLYPLEIQSKNEKISVSDNQGCEEPIVSEMHSSGIENSRNHEITDNRISERRSRLRRVAAETGILKRLISKN